MKVAENDPALRRFERDAAFACVATAILAVIVAAPAWGMAFAGRVAFGVLGGGVLMAWSYRAIKGAADLVMDTTGNGADATFQPEDPGTRASNQPEPPGAASEDRPESGGAGAEDHRPEQACTRASLPAGRKAYLAVKFFTRYALLAVAAYVMLTCLRLHPVGVAAGVTSPFLAAVLQVGRLSRRGGRQPHP